MMQKYTSRTTERRMDDGRIVADIWEWFPVGKLHTQGAYNAQRFVVNTKIRERIYLTMPDGSKVWYYKDTLYPEKPKHYDFFGTEEIIDVLSKM